MPFQTHFMIVNKILTVLKLTSVSNLIKGSMPASHVIRGAYESGQVSLHHSPGDLVERLSILRSYRDLLRHRIVPGSSTARVFRSFYDPLPIQRMYDLSNRYICEDFRVALKRVYRLVGLGVPTHRNGASLFEKLSMSLADPDPYSDASVRVRPLNSYIVKCLQCDTVFLLSGFKSPREILDEVLSDPSSIISAHCAFFNHPLPRSISPTFFHGSESRHVTPAQQVTVMRLVYQYLGYEFSSTAQMQSLSTYVMSGVLFALRTLPPAIILSPSSPAD